MNDPDRCSTEKTKNIQYYRGLFDSMSEAYFVFDGNTFEVIDVNQAMLDMYGVADRAQLKTLNANQLSLGDAPYTANDAEAWMQKAIKEGPQVFEWHARRLDGAAFWTEVNLQPARIDGRECLLSTVRDITKRKELEEAKFEDHENLQQAQKLESLGVLAGGIAHDFNNLLVGILGNAGLALMDLPLNSPARSSIREIESTAKKAADLIRQILAYSGKGRFVVEKLDLCTLIGEMSHLLELASKKKDVIKYNFGSDVPHIEGDAQQLRQVLMNLVSNASEAMGKSSGVITIATGSIEADQEYLHDTFLDDKLEPGTYSYVEVSDSGCGIPKEHKDKIFDPFFTTKFTGRGLGLAAVLGIARGHKGAIKVYSEANRGTSVKIMIPATKLNGKHPSSMPATIAPDDDPLAGTVLVVDDENTVRDVATRMLERLNFSVVSAASGNEGLEIFRKDPDKFNLVLLDLTMPGLDGEQTFREMRRIKKDVCVILSSGYNQQELIVRFAGKGLAGFIQKPYQLSALETTIRKTKASKGSCE